NDRWIEIAAAVAVLVGLEAFLRRTRYGLIIRAGVENRAMVTALGIDVRKAFTLVFALGGIAAALAGVLSGVYFGSTDPARGVRAGVRVAVPPAVLALLIAVPWLGWKIPIVFADKLNTPGTLQLLALCLLFAGVALTYDLLFGFTGLLSFGHALYFAVGVYVCDIAITKWNWSFAWAVLFTAAVGLVLPLVLGPVILRVGGIAFAMVTLAFAQAGAILVQKNPRGWTGGEEGLGYDFERVPQTFVGILNTKHLYWLALGYAALVGVV